MPALPLPTPIGTSSLRAWPLHSAAASRSLEQAALASHAPHALMARAGLGLARLVAAVAPHAQRVWVVAGPGNNGGDGLVAACHLQAWGRAVQVTLLAKPDHLPDDALHAFQAAQAAGVPVSLGLGQMAGADVCVDALLGLGARRAPEGEIAQAIAALNAQAGPVIAVDLPSGLSADTGQPLGQAAVRAQHTLALLTLKPGLFTGSGRDHAGQVWWDGLGDAPDTGLATAWLTGPNLPGARLHVQHKGSFGDVLVLGGADGMAGAAMLAARAALTAGAGRVYLARLGGDALAVDGLRPELMPRRPDQVLTPEGLAAATVVCGCGGGDAVQPLLPAVLAHAGRLVLDADALNALANAPAMWPLLAARTGPTALTPHPLEAARLLGCSVAQVQADRLAAAQALADRAQATVLLKGSGTVIAAPGRLPAINPSGNARLGTAGSGDVLAGWLGAWLAAWPWPDATPAAALPASHGDAAFACACSAAWLHGMAAEAGDRRLPLRAADLIEAMAATWARHTA